MLVCGVISAAIGALRTFDCRVVFIDEVTLDQLDGEAALSHSTASYDHQLVFPEELGHLLVLTAANGVLWSRQHILSKPLQWTPALAVIRGGVQSRTLGSSRSVRSSGAQSRR